MKEKWNCGEVSFCCFYLCSIKQHLKVSGNVHITAIFCNFDICIVDFTHSNLNVKMKRILTWRLCVSLLVWWKSNFLFHFFLLWFSRWRTVGWDIIWLIWNQSYHTQDSGGQTISGPKFRCSCLPLHPLWLSASSRPPHTQTNPGTDPEQWGLCLCGQHAAGSHLTGHSGGSGGSWWQATVRDHIQWTGQHSGSGVLDGWLSERGLIRGCGPSWLSVEKYHPSH